jgi:hypothetical protein
VDPTWHDRRVSKLSPEAVVTRRAEPLTAPVDGDLVMLDPRRSVYFGLDPVGHRIWALLEEPRSVEALCAELQARYDVPEETCRADVLAFIQQLLDAELVEMR